MDNTSKYKHPMQAWPSLKHKSHQARSLANNLSIFFFEDGEENAQTLILIHGLGDEADTWRHVISALAKDYHVIALDLPGFGRSSQPDRDYSPEFFMSTIISLMDKLSIDKTILMGSSLGGILSHGLAINYPNRFSGLILVGGALLQSSALHDWSLKLMGIPMIGEWLYTRLRKDPQAAYDSLRNVYHDLDALPEEDRKFLFERVNQRVWSNEQRRAYFSTLRKLAPWAKAKQKNLKNKLENLTPPTLVIRGEHDSLFSDENAKEIIELQPNTAKVTIDNVGHLPHQENPKAFLRITQDWLSDNY